MAKIKKIIEEGSIQYPATITDAVKNPNNGKTVTQELSELGSKESFIQVRKVDTIQRIKWIEAITNVKIVFEDITPTNYSDIKIAPSLLRRNAYNNDEREVRFKIYEGGEWKQLGGGSYVNTNPVNENGGLTHYEANLQYGTGTVKVSCMVDWDKIPLGTSVFVDGDSVNSEPFFLVKNSKVFLTNVNALSELQKNVASNGLCSFVPESVFFAGNAPSNIIVLETPYNSNTTHEFALELGFTATTSGKLGYKVLDISFWRYQGFTYMPPRYTLTEDVDLPVRLAVNGNGKICIVLGEDSLPIWYYLGRNLHVFVKKVIVNGVGSRVKAIKEGWNFSDYTTIPSDFTEITNVKRYGTPNGYSSDYSNYIKNFTPESSFALPVQEHENYRLKIALPKEFTPSANMRLQADICVNDVANNGYGYSSAVVEFWGRNASTPQYGVCVKDAQFSLNVRIALSEKRYFILLNGNFKQNSTIYVPKITTINYKNEITEDIKGGVEFSEFTEEEVSGYEAVYNPPVVQNATKEDIKEVRQAIENIEVESSDSFLKGKTILCLGDSITEMKGRGETAGIKYTDIIVSKTGAEVINGGIGGTHLSLRAEPIESPTSQFDCYANLDLPSITEALSTGNWTKQYASVKFIEDNNIATVGGYGSSRIIIDRLASVDLTKVDIVTIFIGTNDIDDRNLGEKDDTTSVLSLYGAFRQIAKDLLSKNPNLRIYYFTPLPRYVSNTWDDFVPSTISSNVKWSDNYVNSHGIKFVDMVNACKESALIQHIPVCDFYNTMGINAWNFKSVMKDESEGFDGVHPFRGLTQIANRMISFIESNNNLNV